MKEKEQKKEDKEREKGIARKRKMNRRWKKNKQNSSDSYLAASNNSAIDEADTVRRLFILSVYCIS